MYNNWNPYPKVLKPGATYSYVFATGRMHIVTFEKVTEKGYNFRVLRDTPKFKAGQLLFKRHYYKNKHYVPEANEIMIFMHNGKSAEFVELYDETVLSKFATSLRVACHSLEPQLKPAERVQTIKQIISKLNKENKTTFNIGAHLDSNNNLEIYFDHRDANTWLLNRYMYQQSNNNEKTNKI